MEHSFSGVGGCQATWAGVVAVVLCLAPRGARAQDLEAAHELLSTGQYLECAAAAAEAIAVDSSEEEWHLLKLEAELAVGDSSRALATLDAARSEFSRSIRLLWLGRRAYLANDRTEEAEEALSEIGRLARRYSWRYDDPESRVIIGRYGLVVGADAREVLENVYDSIKKEDPDFVGAYVASGDLALEKHDYGIAVEEFRRALELAPGDPDVLYRLARALVDSDPATAHQHLSAALERNPRHVESLLLLADGAIDREAYDEAERQLTKVLEIHPRQPEALAYRAVLAHLEGDFARENEIRDSALSTWSRNPAVDHLIGRKLSQKYRFREGAEYQRRALTYDAGYLPAKLQLCQDLLRLGDEEEGWKLAREVYETDGYSVVAYNLDILHDHVGSFRTLEEDGISVRMEAHEAEVYGERALDLLRRAKKALCARYDIDLDETILVEIFPEQKDFAIRTFGLPGGAGFLGVCFGSVITANSPASQGATPSNWEAVLWHEFCHVITLHKTRNRMPRWLSEGISVYEEKRENAAWGQSMTPAYLEIVEDGGVTPVSQLSGAFLSPPSPLHLQFAYYQSSLVVEFLVEKHGLETLKAVLDGLAEGTLVNDVLERHIAPLDELDAQFDEYMHARAAELASKADWESLPPEIGVDLEAIERWLDEHPESFWGHQRRALALLSEERWGEAAQPAKRLLELCPEFTGSGNAYELLARIHREEARNDAERAVLEEWAALDADAVGALLRLLELCVEAKDWESVALNAERLLAVNPLLTAPHRDLARAAEEIGAPRKAITSYRALLGMEPVDPAGLHYRLARLFREDGDLENAKRQLLSALEEAPRYRDAHRELLAVVRELAEKPESAPEEKKSSDAEEGREF